MQTALFVQLVLPLVLAGAEPAGAPEAREKAQVDKAEPEALPKEIPLLSLPPPAPAQAGLRWRSAGEELDALASRAESAALAKDPSALARLYRMWNTSQLVGERPRVAAALAKIRDAKGADPLVRAHAAHLESTVLLEQGKRDEAAERARSVGLVDDFWIIGPFENSAGGGHGEVFAPETSIELDSVVPGKTHGVRWRRATGLSPSGTIQPSALVSPGVDATAYVLIVLDAEKPAQVAVRVGATDKVKVFAGGVPVLEQDVLRTAALDQGEVGLALPAGPTPILIKHSWGSEAARLFVRVTAPDGGPVKGVRVLSERSDLERALKAPKYTPPKKPIAVARPADGVEALVKKAKGAERAEALGLRSDLSAILALYDRRKLPTPPEVDLVEAIRLAPGDPTLRFFFAHRVSQTDGALAHEQLEAALVSDPGHVPSIFRLSELARLANRDVDARRLIEAAIARDPTFMPAHASLADLRAESRFEKALALFDLEAVQGGDRSPLVLSEIARHRRALGDRAGAKAAAEKALSVQHDLEGAREILISVAVDAGDLDRALALVDDAIADSPWSYELRTRKAKLLAAKGGDALAVLEEAARLFPDRPEIEELAAELSLRKGDRQQAVAHLDRALLLDPHRSEVRRHRGALLGVKTELEDEMSVDAAALLQAPVTDEERAWGAIYLADRTAVRLYDNGQSTRFRQTVLRVRNAELRDQLRVEHVRYSPGREVVEILTAERIKPNGEVVKPVQIADGGPEGKIAGMYVDAAWKTIAFDDLDEGDLVHLRYRIDTFGENIFGGFFGDTSPLQDRFPKIGVIYRAIAPLSQKLYAGTQRVGAPKVTEEGGTQITEWALDSVPALDIEPLSPPYAELGMTVSVSTYKSWADLGRWYAGLYRDSLQLDEAARAAGRRAVAGAKDDADKIRRLYAYVVKNTRYVGIELGIHGWKPFKASEVHRRRYGDCKDKATLLAALLTDNGVPATIALVRTTDRGPFPPGHASMWAFNHAITYVPGADLFLDGTAEFSGSGELPHPDQGAETLVVYPDGRTELRSPGLSKPEENLNSSRYTATLSPEGALLLSGTETFHGATAAELRQEYEEVEMRKTRLEKTLNQILPGAEITKLDLSDLADLEAQVEYTYTAKVDHYGAADGGRLIIPLTLFRHQVANAYAVLPTRKHDVWISYPWSTRNVIRYALPKGTRVEGLPEGQQIDTKYISLVQKISEVPGGFETDDVVTMKARRIPAAEYPAFREACLAIDRALGRKVVIGR